MWAEAVAELDRREQATERLLPAGQEWFYLHQPLKPRMRVPRLIRCNRVQAVGILATGGQLASANEINGENYSCSCSALHEHESLRYPLYTSAGRSNLIEFCPPEPWGYIALKRQYREPGVCPDYGSPLLKPIAASAGDRVELSAAGIAVNGRAIPNTAPRVLDSINRPLDHYPFGTYVVRPGEVWVASSLELQEL